MRLCEKKKYRSIKIERNHDGGPLGEVIKCWKYDMTKCTKYLFIKRGKKENEMCNRNK